MSWIINILGLLASWYFTDIESDSVLQGIICPIFIGVFLISIVVKVVFLLGPDSGRGGSGGDGGGFLGGGDGGDGGC